MRETGQGWPNGGMSEPVGPTSVRADLVLLRTLLNWATNEKLTDGSWLLAENPLRGLELPEEKNPRRPVATYDRFLATRAACKRLAAKASHRGRNQRWIRLEVALVLAEATGKRRSAIARLRWSDVNWTARTIRDTSGFSRRFDETRLGTRACSASCSRRRRRRRGWPRSMAAFGTLTAASGRQSVISSRISTSWPPAGGRTRRRCSGATRSGTARRSER